MTAAPTLVSAPQRPLSTQDLCGVGEAGAPAVQGVPQPECPTQATPLNCCLSQGWQLWPPGQIWGSLVF